MGCDVSTLWAVVGLYPNPHPNLNPNPSPNPMACRHSWSMLHVANPTIVTRLPLHDLFELINGID